MLDQPHDPRLIAGPYVEKAVSKVLAPEVYLTFLQLLDGHVREVRSRFAGHDLELLQSVGKAGHGQLGKEIESCLRSDLIRQGLWHSNCSSVLFTSFRLHTGLQGLSDGPYFLGFIIILQRFLIINHFGLFSLYQWFFGFYLTFMGKTSISEISWRWFKLFDDSMERWVSAGSDVT